MHRGRLGVSPFAGFVLWPASSAALGEIPAQLETTHSSPSCKLHENAWTEGIHAVAFHTRTGILRMPAKRRLLYLEGSSIEPFKGVKSGVATPQPDVKLIDRRLS